MRILYTIDNLIELFEVPGTIVKQWVKHGDLTPTSKGPLRFSKKYIDEFVNDGKLELLRPVPVGTRKGVWS